MSIILIGCSTCLAYREANLNDSVTPADLTQRYNQEIALTEAKNMNLQAGPIEKYRSTDENDCYRSILQNGDKIAYACNKKGKVFAAEIVSRTQQMMAYEVALLVCAFTDFERIDGNFKNAYLTSRDSGKAAVWYSPKMQRYYSITLEKINEGKYLATIVSVVE